MIVQETSELFDGLYGGLESLTGIFTDLFIVTIVIGIVYTIIRMLFPQSFGLFGSRRSRAPRAPSVPSVRAPNSPARRYFNPHKSKPKPKKEVVFKPKDIPSTITLPVFCQIHGMTNKFEYSHKKGFLCQICGRFVCLDCQKEISLAGMGNCPFCMNSLKSVEVKV
jgi:hypothetical protein